MRQLRTAPLAECPDLHCRRDGRCRVADAPRACLKTSMTMDELREELAAKLHSLCDEVGAPRSGWTEDEGKDALASLYRDFEKRAKQDRAAARKRERAQEVV